MKINQLSKNIEERLEQSTKRSEKKYYQRILQLINSLEERALKREDRQSIEEKIDELQLSMAPVSSFKEIKQSTQELLKFLRIRFSLIPQGYYMTLGISLGVAFGAALGPVIQSITGNQSFLGVSISMGMVFGMLIGIHKDAEAERQDRVLFSRKKTS